MKKSKVKNIIKKSTKKLVNEQAGSTNTTDPWGNPWVFPSGYGGGSLSGPYTQKTMSPGVNSVKCPSGYVLDIYYSWSGTWGIFCPSCSTPFPVGGQALRGYNMRCIPGDATLPPPPPPVDVDAVGGFDDEYGTENVPLPQAKLGVGCSKDEDCFLLTGKFDGKCVNGECVFGKSSAEPGNALPTDPDPSAELAGQTPGELDQDTDQVGLLGFACNGVSCYKTQGGQFTTLAACQAECPYPGSANPSLEESEIKRMQKLAGCRKK